MNLEGLSHLQSEHAVWVKRNFPNDNAHSPLLGLIEEVGELSHAHLKNEQGIRCTAEEHRAAAADAIGDIVIYLTSYCNRNGYDLETCVGEAWVQVRDRDWITYPTDGRTC